MQNEEELNEKKVNCSWRRECEAINNSQGNLGGLHGRDGI